MPPQKPDIRILLMGSTSKELTNFNPLTAGLNVVSLDAICAFALNKTNKRINDRIKSLCFILLILYVEKNQRSILPFIQASHPFTANCFKSYFVPVATPCLFDNCGIFFLSG